MPKYFVDDNGLCHGECVVDNPVNPEGWEIIELDKAGEGWIRNKETGEFEAPPPQPPKEAPRTVSRFQGMAALLQIGMLEDIEKAIADSNDEFLKIAWQNVQEFDRHSALMSAMQPVLGLSDREIDDLFVFAATIKG